MKTINCLWSADVRNIQEDDVLMNLVGTLGKKRWGEIASMLSEMFSNPKKGKQCRERWCNQLDQTLHHGDWLSVEEDRIFKLSRVYGNRWSVIAKCLHGRSENSIKNYFYSTVRKNIRRINKSLIIEKIVRPINELRNDPIVSWLVFCSDKKSKIISSCYKNSLDKKNSENISETNLETQDYYSYFPLIYLENNSEIVYFDILLGLYYGIIQALSIILQEAERLSIR